MGNIAVVSCRVVSCYVTSPSDSISTVTTPYHLLSFPHLTSPFLSGCPPPEKLVLINSAAAMNSILHYRYRVPKPFASYFPPETSPLALDLISKMLQFHPDDRISVESALEHPYLAEYHIQMPEPVCQDLFNFEFEKVNYDLSSEDVQLLMYEEMLLYRPSATQFPRDMDQGSITDMAGAHIKSN